MKTARNILRFPVEAVPIRSICLALALTLTSGACDNVAVDDPQSAFERGDYEKAASLVRPLAEQGVAEAQFMLGTMYFDGQGVPQDHAEAFKWLRRAALQGIAESQYVLGIMYDQGEGIREDDAEAVKWYRLAADQGNVNAQYNLAIMYDQGGGIREDDAEAVKWYRLWVDQTVVDVYQGRGSEYRIARLRRQQVETQNRLGVMYRDPFMSKKP